jgi:hypothetical protein
VSDLPGFKAVLRRFKATAPEVQARLPELERLLKEFSWQVCVSYMSMKIEIAKHLTLYCGIVKLHHADAQLTWGAVERCYMSRKDFKNLFETVFNSALPAAILSDLESFEDVRDKVMHGKEVDTAKMRKAMGNALDFAETLNAHLWTAAGFRPFSDLRGFKGRAQSLDKSTSRWILKGMSLPA